MEMEVTHALVRSDFYNNCFFCTDVFFSSGLACPTPCDHAVCDPMVLYPSVFILACSHPAAHRQMASHNRNGKQRDAAASIESIVPTLVLAFAHCGCWRAARFSRKKVQERGVSANKRHIDW